MQQPLAIAVIGGLITNMLITRLLIPVGWMAGARIVQVFNVLFRPDRAAGTS
jgi:Cu/Ag efflux pump CusA